MWVCCVCVCLVREDENVCVCVCVCGCVCVVVCVLLVVCCDVDFYRDCFKINVCILHHNEKSSLWTGVVVSLDQMKCYNITLKIQNPF